MLKQRVLTALVLVGGLLGLLFFAPPVASSVLFAALAAVGAWEWSSLMGVGPRGRGAFAIAVLLICALVALAGGAAHFMLWVASSCFWLVLVPFWLAGRWTLSKTPLLGHALGALVLVATWSALSALLARGPLVLLAILATVWVADIAAYFTGRAFGRRKLAPNISPGKTWEGAVGAAVGVAIYGGFVGPRIGLWSGIPLAVMGGLLVLTAISIVGDLFESLLKRQAGVKDSGSIFPGHGGVLDRIDSLTSSMPLVALALSIVAATA